MSDDQLGFTLIELLIVIVVLGILAAVVVFALSGTGAQSASAACNADAKTVDVAVAAYDAQTGYSGSGTTPPAPTAALLVPTYLRSFPSSSLYIIGLTSTGVVTVQAPPSASAVPYDTNNTCGTLSSNSGSSTSVATTTVAPTTTTAVSNGVTATPSVPSNSNPYGAQEELSLTNGPTITALSITITVAQTGGLAETQQYNSFPSGVTNANSTSGSAITYTYVLTSGSIPAAYNGGNVYAQFSDNGIAHPTSGDLWSVTSTSGGVTSTLNGHF
jgi:prepilin-type N-terminal cleavage/methylation domain-containing protein